MARAAGFAITGFEDVSRRVARTWPICAGRLVTALLTDREHAASPLALATATRFYAFPA